jgi:hypothetical protein
MKIIISLLMTIVCGIGATAQTGAVPENINIPKPLVILPETARFQILIMYTQIGEVFKLDRQTGKTYVYNAGRVKWILLDVRGGLPAVPNTSAPRYQIYDTGSGYYPFLINSDTGQSWFLVTRTWEPITD